MRDFTRKLEALSNASRKIPNTVAAIAVNFSKERFRDQAWLDQTKEVWKPRKRKRPGGRSQTLLVDTGRLKRSIRKISATPTQVVIGTDVPYAKAHNEGAKGTRTVSVKAHKRAAHSRSRKGRKEIVKSHTVSAHSRKQNFNLPARPFIGGSYTLSRRIELHIAAEFTRALKS